MKEFFKKVIDIFKKIWFVMFIPIGMFFVSLLFNKKDSSVIKDEIKETKKDIKKETEELKTVEEIVEETKKAVLENNEELKQVIESNLDDKESRDKNASKFFNF